jgi:hypothetical protein
VRRKGGRGRRRKERGRGGEKVRNNNRVLGYFEYIVYVTTPPAVK